MLCSRSIRYHIPLGVDLEYHVIALILSLGAYRCHVGVHMWNITLGQYLRATSIIVSLSLRFKQSHSILIILQPLRIRI